ncbi:MAG: hypothetical protein RJA70_1974 [Pseudomonadota bacterium]|jgi:hypothetical protein
MRFIERNLKHFERWLLIEYRTPRSSIEFCRVLFALYFLAVGAHDFSWVGELPDELYYPPPGVMSAFSEFPSSGFMVGIRVAMVASAILMLFGVHTAWASLGLGLGLMLSYGAAYSVGKVTHNILYVVAPIFMALIPWGPSAKKTPWRPRFWPLSVFAALFAYLMLTAAVPKLLFGWLSTDSSAVYAYAVEAQLLRDPVAPRWLTRAIPWELVDWATIVFEFALLACLPRASAFRAICAVSAVFHLMVFLLLDISFATNLVAYALFFDWSRPLMRLQGAELWGAVRRARLTFRWWYAPLAAALYVLLFPEAPLNMLLHALGVRDRVPLFATAADLLLIVTGGLAGAAYLGYRGYVGLAGQSRAPRTG